MKNFINEVVDGRYLVQELIGRGGFSAVYRVRDIKTGNCYAMKKYITSNPGDSQKMLEGLEREMNVLKNTSHPNLPKFLNLIKADNSFYLIMELVKGQNLKTYVDDNGPLAKNNMKKIMRQVLSGLYYLHSLDPPIVYRDLKPENIIIDSEFNVKLIDFGIAKRYSKEIDIEEKCFGSKGFAAPEQYGDLQGRPIYNTDIRTDIYTVGTTLYYLATGQKHTNGHTSIRWGRKMARAILKCTQINPEDRYQSVLELLVLMI